MNDKYPVTKKVVSALMILVGMIVVIIGVRDKNPGLTVAGAVIVAAFCSLGEVD